MRPSARRAYHDINSVAPPAEKGYPPQGGAGGSVGHGTAGQVNFASLPRAQGLLLLLLFLIRVHLPWEGGTKIKERELVLLLAFPWLTLAT